MSLVMTDAWVMRCAGTPAYPPVILRMSGAYPEVPACAPQYATALKHADDAIRADGACVRPCVSACFVLAQCVGVGVAT